MKKLVVFLMVLGLVIAGSGMALATSVTLVPSAANVAPGSTVDVSVDISVDNGFGMTAINAVILYDPTVFTYVDPSVVQGDFLAHDWFPMGGATTPGTLIVGAIDWTDFAGEYLNPGFGTLFTFTLLANINAPLGLSTLSWGDAGSGVGFGYGNSDFMDEVLPSYGASINVGTAVPEPATMLLLGLGLMGLAGIRRKFKK